MSSLTLLHQYLLETTVHGFKYVAAKPDVARVCWAVAIVASLAIAGHLVVSSVREDSRNPLVTSFESASVHQEHSIKQTSIAATTVVAMMSQGILDIAHTCVYVIRILCKGKIHWYISL